MNTWLEWAQWTCALLFVFWLLKKYEIFDF
jgi:hypothetical protein